MINKKLPDPYKLSDLIKFSQSKSGQLIISGLVLGVLIESNRKHLNNKHLNLL